MAYSMMPRVLMLGQSVQHSTPPPFFISSSTGQRHSMHDDTSSTPSVLIRWMLTVLQIIAVCSIHTVFQMGPKWLRGGPQVNVDCPVEINDIYNSCDNSTKSQMAKHHSCCAVQTATGIRAARLWTMRESAWLDNNTMVRLAKALDCLVRWPSSLHTELCTEMQTLCSL